MAHVTNESAIISRFFTKEDLKSDKFVFNLPSSWWSRPYEYIWAANFVKKEDVVLDAASGICHPFKFYLARICDRVYACDTDERINSPSEILKDVVDVFGETAARDLPKGLMDRILYCRASITSLPYEDKKFDEVYCISVIEHLDDFFNKHSSICALRGILSTWLSHNIYLSLSEFRRVLKDDGLIVLTFDYPRINMGYFRRIVSTLGLTFAGDAFFKIPQAALYSEEHNLYCFRAVLKRRDVV